MSMQLCLDAVLLADGVQDVGHLLVVEALHAFTTDLKVKSFQ